MKPPWDAKNTLIELTFLWKCQSLLNVSDRLNIKGTSDGLIITLGMAYGRA
jgi:hypothetical protein